MEVLSGVGVPPTLSFESLARAKRDLLVDLSLNLLQYPNPVLEGAPSA